MKKPLLTLLAATLVGLPVWAQHSQKQIEEDVRRHRAMAAAHEAAAKCLESGRGEKVCMQELQTACKGLALGKYCGMRHAH
jgi:hypothetical protein